MNTLNSFSLNLLIFGLVLMSCRQGNEENSYDFDDQSFDKIHVKYRADTTDHFVMIYDYDTEAAKLQYRPIKIENQTGDYLKDAIQAFLLNNHFLEPTDSIQLDKIEKKESVTHLFFSGLKESGEQENKADFFKKALELTMARNFQKDQFQIILNEEFP